MRILSIAAVAIAVLPLVTGQIASLSSCGQSCYGDLVAKGASLGCPGGEPACLCNNGNFQNGMDDCAHQLCPSQGQDAGAQINIVKAFCATIQPGTTPPAPASAPSGPQTAETPVAGAPAPSSPPPPPPPSLPSPSPVTSVESAETSSTLLTAPTAAQSSPNTPAVPSPSASTGAAQATQASPSATALTTLLLDPTSTASATPTSSTSQPSGVAAVGASAGSPDGTASSTGRSSTGLSTNDRIGIAVGCGAAGLLFILAVLLIRSRRRTRNLPTGRKISEPLPGSGRHPGGGDTPPRLPDADLFVEKTPSELEMTARRYEDMVPRQKPRQLV